MAASIVFYGAYQPKLLLLLLLSLIINVLASHAVVHGNPTRRWHYAAIGVIFNLVVLVSFKYGPLLATTTGLDATSIGHLLVVLPLPLGISFFTFHGITLLVDTFRARNTETPSTVDSNLWIHGLRTSLYFLFFPQLVAGPITKSRNFYPQIVPKTWSDVRLSRCFRQTTLGFFMKIVVADNLAQQTFWIAYPYFMAKSSADLVVMLVGYSMQIFADFAGYSLIALGVAGLFGYRLPENFNSPYLSKSFSEFWTRWHISLSSFLREYLYVPLGGNRHGSLRTYINLLVVMVLGGLWHGAAWSFLVWGAAHGFALAIERFVGNHYTPPNTVAIKITRAFGVFLYVSCAWLLFKLTDFAHVLQYLRSFAGNWELENSPGLLPFVLLYSIPVVVWHWAKEFRASSRVLRSHRVEPVIYGAMIFLMITNTGTPQDFVYFQF
ncbi:MAG: MBOAT family protein [Lysobacterales bacterium]